MNPSVSPRILTLAAVLGNGLAMMPFGVFGEDSEAPIEAPLVEEMSMSDEQDSSNDNMLLSPENEAVSRAFSSLAFQLHRVTFKAIRAEIFGDGDEFEVTLQKLFPLVQKIGKLAEDSPEYPEVQRILEKTRSLALQIDRIEYTHSRKNQKETSWLVGKLADSVKDLENMLLGETGNLEHADATATIDAEHD